MHAHTHTHMHVRTCHTAPFLMTTSLITSWWVTHVIHSAYLLAHSQTAYQRGCDVPMSYLQLLYGFLYGTHIKYGCHGESE